MEDIRHALNQTDWRTPFETDGYIVLRSILTPAEHSALRAETEHLNPPCPGEMPGAFEALSGWIPLLERPEVMAPVLQILGSQIHLVHSSIASIPSGADSMVWHEDGPRPWSYPSVDGIRSLVLLRMGIPLSSTTAQEHGQLMVIPGSHRMAFPHPSEAEQIWERSDIKRVDIPEGGAVLFHNGLWHTTAPNHLAIPRRQLYLVFAPLWHRKLDYQVLPEKLENALSAFPEPRQSLLRQFLDEPNGGCGIRSMFPDPQDAPALELLQPEKPASGA